MKTSTIITALLVFCCFSTTWGQITHTVHKLPDFTKESNIIRNVQELQDGSLLLRISRGITDVPHIGVIGLVIANSDGSARHTQIVQDSAFLYDFTLIQQRGDTLHIATSIDTLFFGGDVIGGGDFKVPCHFLMSVSTGKILDMWLPSVDEYLSGGVRRFIRSRVGSTVQFTDTSVFHAYRSESRDSLHIEGVESAMRKFLGVHKFTFPTEKGSSPRYWFTKIPSDNMYVYSLDWSKNNKFALTTWAHDGTFRWHKEIPLPDSAYARTNLQYQAPVIMDNKHIAVAYSGEIGIEGVTGVTLLDDDGNLIWKKNLLRTENWFYPHIVSLQKTSRNTLLGVAEIRWRFVQRPADSLYWYFFELDKNGTLLWDYNDYGKANMQFGVALFQPDPHTVWGFGFNNEQRQVRMEITGIPTSVAEAPALSVALFPQPATEFITLQGISPEQMPARYSVTTLIGNTVQQGIMSSTQVPIINLPSGVYFLSLITSDGKQMSKQFVISK